MTKYNRHCCVRVLFNIENCGYKDQGFAIEKWEKKKYNKKLDRYCKIPKYIPAKKENPNLSCELGVKYRLRLFDNKELEMETEN